MALCVVVLFHYAIWNADADEEPCTHQLAPDLTFLAITGSDLRHTGALVSLGLDCSGVSIEGLMKKSFKNQLQISIVVSISLSSVKHQQKYVSVAM